MNIRIRPSGAFVLLLGMAAAPFASAQSVAAKAETAAVTVPVGLLDVEFIAHSISTRGPRTLVIHYFAECQVERGHVEYDIVVGRPNVAATARVAEPTSDIMSALCSNDGDTTESNLRAKSVGTVVACTVSNPGEYVVKVRGHVEAPDMPGPAVVDDQSLVIETHDFAPELLACTFEGPGGVGSGG